MGGFVIAHFVAEEFQDNLCRVVGHLVVGWAFVEQMLDMCVAIVWQSAGGKHMKAYPTIPRSEKRKIEFLEDALADLPGLAPFAADLKPLLTKAKELVQDRHTIVHGVLSAYDEKTQRITFTMLNAKPAIHHVVQRKLTFSRMLAAGGECQTLTEKFGALAERLTETFVA